MFLFRAHQNKRLIGCLYTNINSVRKMSASNASTTSTRSAAPSEELLELLGRAKTAVPPLTNSLHKGELGRIAVIGGSTEYTGAPYFAAISALKLGADLVHVFCVKDAAPVIKSYSPELIVHPVLDTEDAVEKIQSHLGRIHVFIVGPGLGTDPTVLDITKQLLSIFRANQKPVVLDADGFKCLEPDLSNVKNFKYLVMTPNAHEYQQIFRGGDFVEIMSNLGAEAPSVLVKGERDEIYTSGDYSTAVSVYGGSPRRCGGQGDLLSGCIATFLHWTIRHGEREPVKVAAAAACVLVKEFNRRAFLEKGRSMTASDMIEKIHEAFEDLIEPRSNKMQ